MHIQKQIIEFIISSVPRETFLSLEEAVSAAYAKAEEFAGSHFPHIGPGRIRGQMRRYLIDAAMAGLISPAQANVHQTCPRGEHFIVLKFGDISMSQICLHHYELARPAKHRLMLAKKNEHFEQTHPDLFMDVPKKHGDSLHVVVLVVHPKATALNQTEPAIIEIAVPHTDWRGYHLRLPLSGLMASYTDMITSVQPDTAWPRLREAIVKTEGEQSFKQAAK